MQIAIITIVLLSEFTLWCKAHCVGTCYSGRILPEPEDIFHKKYLKGFTYKNINTDDPKKCYSSCIQDCRCKACQMKDARCELLDEDKTSKADNFTSGPGYVYYDLKQTMYQGKSHMIPQGMCYNGCCRSQPCMNGGTCAEHCQSPKKKFSCKCTTKYYGKVCENQLIIASCMDVMKFAKSVPKNGIYNITRTDNKYVIPLYCAFVSPNQAWTLIESFALSNNVFKREPFYHGSPYNQEAPPSWDRFRLRTKQMRYIRAKSTLFRATCDFPKRSGSLTPDLLIGSLSDVDIINEKDFLRCKKYKFVDIRGHQCTDCTALTGHGGLSKWHFHLDVTHNSCDFRPPFQTHNVDSFGCYATIESVSKCTATRQSTTQWWLGQER